MALSPGKVAERIEAAGWEVELYTSPARLRATRRNEKITVLWHPSGEFVRARYFIDDVEQTEAGLDRIGEVLAQARQRPVGLPFSMTDDDETILAALAGKTISWASRYTDKPMTGTVPRGGLHLKITYNDAGRMITFTDHLGFHTVRLAQIMEVS